MTNLTNITENQISSKGVQSLADRPNANAQYGVGGLSSTQLKLRFDNLASFLAGKINELQDALASDTAADYIRIPLDVFGVGSLKDLVDSFASGDFANKILRLNPSATTSTVETLQAIINDIAKVIAEHSEKITEHEDLLVKSLEITVIDGKLYLGIIRTKGDPERVELDDIFEGFVKSYANDNRFRVGDVYSISPDGNNLPIGTDYSRDPTAADWAWIVMRDSSYGIPLPQDSRKLHYAASVNQVNNAVSSSRNYTDEKLEEAKSYTTNTVGNFAQRVQNEIGGVNYRLEQLESAILKFTEYSGVTDAVPVPENAAKYALVDKVGGMTYKGRSPDNLFPAYIDDKIPKNAGETLTTDGVSVTLNSDYSITLNGTSNGFFLLFSDESFYSQNGHTFSFGTKLPEGTVLAYDTLTFTDEETGEEWWDTQRDDISSGEVTIDVTNFSILTMEFPHNAVFNNITLYPTYSKSRDAIPYFFGLRDTNVTELVSEVANGTLVDAIDIPEAVKNRLPEHFEFGDGIDKDVCNYLNLETETVHGNVATMVLDGSEDGWKAKTSSTTGITRFQINYSEAPGYLGYPAASAPSTREATLALCNAYESVSASDNNSGARGIAFSATTFFVHDPAFSTLDAWLAHLKNNPLTVVYKVANPVTENVSDIIGDTFNRLVVSPLGKIKPISEYNTAAPITVSFVEAKGVYV